MAARVCGTILIFLASFLVYVALWARIDTLEDRSFIRAWDFVLGGLFALDVHLCAKLKKGFVRVAWPVAIWAFVSGSLLLLHESQVRIRWSISPRALALCQVKAASEGLEDYARDCGSFPSMEQGLGALCTNPGIEKWSGPYLSAKRLIDPWGNPLQYKLRDNRAEVWSPGPDGVSGTADDIRQEAGQREPGDE